MPRLASSTISGILRQRLMGWSVDALARLHRVSRADVLTLLSCPLPPRPAPRPTRPVPVPVSCLPRPGRRREPRPKDPHRAIRGRLVSRVKARHLAGEAPEAIAAAELLDLVVVRAFLARAFPGPRSPRPRPAREPRPPANWSGWRLPPAPPVEAPPSAAAGELVDATVARPVVVEGPGWVHYQRSFPGPRKLTWERAEEMRRRRAEGATRAELAAHYGVSRGTVDGVLARRVYRSPDD